jgi:hypothetical protein
MFITKMSLPRRTVLRGWARRWRCPGRGDAACPRRRVWRREADAPVPGVHVPNGGDTDAER